MKFSHAGGKDIKSSDGYAKGGERERIKSWAKPKSSLRRVLHHIDYREVGRWEGGGWVVVGRWGCGGGRRRQSVLCLLFLLSYGVSHSPSNKNVTMLLLASRGNRWCVFHFIMSSK